MKVNDIDNLGNSLGLLFTGLGLMIFALSDRFFQGYEVTVLDGLIMMYSPIIAKKLIMDNLFSNILLRTQKRAKEESEERE